MFEQLSDAEIMGEFGRAEVIFDEYGILLYSSDPGLTLTRYLGLLKRGGRIYSYGEQRSVRVGNQVKRFVDWLETIPGIEVTRLDQSPIDPYAWKHPDPSHGIRIIKRDESVVLPNLILSTDGVKSDPQWVDPRHP